MDFIRRTIIDHETVITKELLDSFQDGIIEAITKAEAALDIPPSIYDAATHNEFPSVGDPDVIYKASEEKRLYQWNPDELKYEALITSVPLGDISDGTTISGGGANISDDPSGEGVTNVVIDGGGAGGIGT